MRCLIMMEELKNLLHEKGYNIFSKKIDDIEYNYCFTGDRVYFFSDISDIEDSQLREYSNDMAINIAQLVKKDKYKEFFTSEVKFSNGDLNLVTESLDLKAFLWDLYIISIRISDENDFFPNEVISQLQREKLIARRIIIQEETIEEALVKLTEEFSSTDKLNTIFLKYKKDTNESSIIENLLDENLVDEVKRKSGKKSIALEIKNRVPKENILLKERIKQTKKNDGTSINLDDIENYLDNIKNLYEEAREYLK